MTDDKRNHLKNRLQKLTDRLRVLELQKDEFGLSVPPHIVTSIQETKNEIEQIETQIADKAITQILNSKSSTRSSIGVLPLILSFFLVSGVIGWFAYRRGEDKAKVLGQTTVASLSTSTLQPNVNQLPTSSIQATSVTSDNIVYFDDFRDRRTDGKGLKETDSPTITLKVEDGYYTIRVMDDGHAYVSGLPVNIIKNFDVNINIANLEIKDEKSVTMRIGFRSTDEHWTICCCRNHHLTRNRFFRKNYFKS